MPSRYRGTLVKFGLLALVVVAVLVWAFQGQLGQTPRATPTGAVAAATGLLSGILPSTSVGPTGSPSNPAGSPGIPGGGDPGTVTIVAAGDIACDPAKNVGQPADCDQAATAALIGQLHPNAVLTLGDNQYEDGTLSAFQQSFSPTWGRYRSIMHPAIGNHEYLTPGATGYFDYFGVPAYYSFDLGGWHLVSLDSECSYIGGCGRGSAEETWLRQDLATHFNLCTLVYWHEPRWSSGEHQDAKQMVTIWSDVVAAGVDVVLSGHNHDYERFEPLDGSGAPSASGTTEFVVGTGGKNHYGFVTGLLPGELVRNDASFGVISMSLGATGYSWRFVPAAGYTFTDSGSATCH